MSFDLNLANYKIEELKSLFSLQPGYDISAIENKENGFKEIIRTDSKIAEQDKPRIISFIRNASAKLKETLIDTDRQQFIIPKIKPDDPKLEDLNIGSVAPLDLGKSSIKQHLNIDSRFRQNYEGTPSSNFFVDLPTRLVNVLSMQMHSFEYPTTLYNISENIGNNRFSIELNTGFLFNIELPSGIYTSPTTIANPVTGPASLEDAQIESSNILVQILNQIYLIANLSTTDSVSKSQLLALCISTSLGNRMTIYSTLAEPFTLYFQTSPSGESDPAINVQMQLGWMLGYRRGLYTNFTTYTTEGNMDLIYPKYVYLYVDDYNKNMNSNFFNSALTTSLITNNIIARITPTSPTNTSNGVYLSGMIANTTFRCYWGSVKISRIHIQLLDEFGRNIDTQHMDFSFVLALDIRRG